MSLWCTSRTRAKVSHEPSGSTLLKVGSGFRLTVAVPSSGSVGVHEPPSTATVKVPRLPGTSTKLWMDASWTPAEFGQPTVKVTGELNELRSTLPFAGVVKVWFTVPLAL